MTDNEARKILEEYVFNITHVGELSDAISHVLSNWKPVSNVTTKGEAIEKILNVDRDCVDVHGENNTMTFTVTQEWWNSPFNNLCDTTPFNDSRFGVK